MAPPPRRNPQQNPTRRKGEEPWLAASLRPANFLPGLAIGFLLGLLLDLSSSWRPKSSSPPAPAAAPARGSSSKRASGSSFASGGEELKMVLVVRQDLKMGAGKIASQCAHAATGLYAELFSSNRGLLRQWEQLGQAKIVLTCKNQQEMNRLKETAEHRGIPTFIVADAGRTEVLAGSKTVLAIGPAASRASRRERADQLKPKPSTPSRAAPPAHGLLLPLLAASRRGRSARQAPFFRDLATPIPSHRGVSRFASGASPSATPPPPPIFTLDDRYAAADFSPDPTASDLLPVASSPSPRAAASRSPPWDLSRGKVSLATRIPHGWGRRAGSERGARFAAAREPWRPTSCHDSGGAVTGVPAQAPAGTEPVANGGEVEREEWVTVFGFSIGDTNLVLREFEKCGVILRHHSGPRDGNWIHILYQRSYDAQKALQKNGIQLSSGLIVGVKPIDAVHRQQLDESFARSSQGGFMVSLPSKSLGLKSTGASHQLGALPRPYDPKANTNVSRDAGRRATGSVAAPAKSILTNVMDLIFGI
ncbi:unnamed protein product [Miscanthus lutarioriparius]|uniref:peptidyl-tRNA hydrolase n=1 Tax=Miscanthus lutarioriparius TaxID=422564 RepID=A0A811RX17_9POAL|nr:unnamed protein product [Miscanthus lutarioriparius]